MKPSSIAFGVDDRPPWPIALGSALQHWMLALATLAFPMLVIDEARRFGKIGDDQAHTMLVVSYLALGLATLLQTLRGRGFGSGFLIPSVFVAAFLPANLAAVQIGGLGAVFGMTIFAGLVEIALAFVVRRFPEFFPTEVTGVIVLLVGLVLGMVGVRLMFSLSESGWAGGSEASSTWPAGITVAVAVMLAVWFTGALRAMSVMIGMVVGTLASLALSDASITALIGATPQGSWVWPVAVPSFHAELAFPYAAAALVCALRAIGDITTAQRINDANWKRPDPKSICSGVVADGLGNVASGSLGAVGLNTFSGSVGLSLATGIASRRVGFLLAGLHVAAALTPGVAILATHIPRPVLGAALLLSACFIVVNAMQAIVSQALDNRKIFVVSLALFCGLSRNLYPGLYADLPGGLSQLLTSELSVGVLVLLCLVPLFRLGAARRQRSSLRLDGGQYDALVGFIRDSAASLGARIDSMNRAVMAGTEFIELAPSVVDAGTPIELASSYDDFVLRLTFSYTGEPLQSRQTAATPDPTAIHEDERALRRFGVALMGRLCDGVKITHSGRACSVQLSFR